MQSRRSSESVNIAQLDANNIYICCRSGPNRSIYVVDLLDLKVHVLDRKQDNTLVPVKVGTDVTNQLIIYNK